MNFFPSAVMAANGYARTDVYANTRCVKEEKITLHIPQERLDAARFDGLTIVVLGQDGSEVPVYLPPNYIEGFRKAVSGYGGTMGYSSGQPYSGQTTTTTAPYASGGSYPLSGRAPQGSYPQQ